MRKTKPILPSLLLATAYMVIVLSGGGASAAITTSTTVYSANPRYLTNNGTPVVFLGAGGPTYAFKTADYRAYIDSMASHNVNYGRIWTVLPWVSTQVYFPWARDAGGTAKDGQPKFNLTHWDSNYWSRLKDACAYAQSKNIYLSIILFDECGVEAPQSTGDHRWDTHPFNPQNNVNGLSLPTSPDGIPEFYSLTNSNLKSLQSQYVSKMITETSGYPNVIYEICNEYTGPWDWEKYWIDYLTARCSNIISVNRLGSVPSNYWTDSNIDVVNYHWGTLDPATTNKNMVSYTTNSGTPKAVKYDEPPESSSTSFATYRKVSWSAFVGGGHIHLEDWGSEAASNDAILYLRKFINDNGVQFWGMKPSNSLVTSSPGGSAYTLAKSGSEYVTYIVGSGGGSMNISLASGIAYTAKAYNPSNGTYTNLSVSGNTISGIPSYSTDMVIYVKASGTTTSNPSVSLTLSANKTSAASGDTITYTITYKNTGSGAAQSVAVTNPIPQNTTYVAGSATSSGTYSSTANAVTWTISSISAGGTGTLTFQVKVN